MEPTPKTPRPLVSTTPLVAPSEPALRAGVRGASLLAGTRDGLRSLPELVGVGIRAALALHRSDGPLPEGTAAAVLGAAAALLGPAELPAEGMGAEAAVRLLAQVLTGHGLDLAHPRAAAHLQPPPLAVAVAADVLASASNASLDTYDSGPSAIAVERWLIALLVRLAGLGPRADGVLTPGGSLSNMLGLLLARDAAALRRGLDVRRQGAAGLVEPVVFCSEVAHFSVHRACAALGLGESAVMALPTDTRHRLRPEALAQALRGIDRRRTVVAVVATAGTTDFGSIDPLQEIGAITAEHGVWLHVDAAYGFGALFSDRLSARLRGLEHADSITLDLHKLGWQPAAASVLLVRDASAFAALDRQVAYLNPEDDTMAGYDGLLGRSLQTTRRPDAVKIAATLLAHGRRGLGGLVDTCHDLARHAQARIEREPALELVAPAQLTTVVFRYRGDAEERARLDADPHWLDEVNGALRRRLIRAGTALVGRTSVRGRGAGATARVCLKLTLLNPEATPRDIDGLVDEVLQAGRACTATRAEALAGPRTRADRPVESRA